MVGAKAHIGTDTFATECCAHCFSAWKGVPPSEPFALRMPRQSAHLRLCSKSPDLWMLLGQQCLGPQSASHESSLVQQDFNCLGVWLFQIVCSYLDTYIDCQCTSTYVKHLKIHGIRNVDTCICVDTGVHALGRYVYTYICVYICRQ